MNQNSKLMVDWCNIKLKHVVRFHLSQLTGCTVVFHQFHRFFVSLSFVFIHSISFFCLYYGLWFERRNQTKAKRTNRCWAWTHLYHDINVKQMHTRHTFISYAPLLVELNMFDVSIVSVNDDQFTFWLEFHSYQHTRSSHSLGIGCWFVYVHRVGYCSSTDFSSISACNFHWHRSLARSLYI